MADYPKPEEVHVPWTEVERMRGDESLIVLMTIKGPDGDDFIVSFWRKDRGVLPPWLKIAA